ncbi:MAG TPA: hypothetical protein VMT68_03605 [Caulobacteraceae bacterium]|nr:hypothetical protein [Caulobacteraceae bacterium]
MGEPKNRQRKTRSPVHDGVQGEGDYAAGRRFQAAERRFAEKKSVVTRKAREAAEALDGPESADLEQARRDTGEGKVRPHPPAHKAGRAVDPHTDEALDKGLDETFPASDPVSISPGAD